jgi:methylmalonyl-CoA mutase N-terminal domain/subunit
MQKKRLAEIKQCRNQDDVIMSLNKIKQASIDGANLMPVLIEAAHNYVTLAEMIGEMKEVFGIYEETVVF